MNDDEITRSVDVPVSPPEAWDLFVHRFPDWWPREHCFCGEADLDTVFINLDTSTWGEMTRRGACRIWGAVLARQPAQALTLSWQMDATVSPWEPEPDAARASLIDIAFVPRPDGTRITLRHHGFSRQGEPHAQAMRAVMVGMDRWREWLDLFRGFAAPSS